jgi:hypothetical protein
MRSVSIATLVDEALAELQQPRQTPLILRSTIVSSGSMCTFADAGTSAARGWRWPTGADHGLVVVSFRAETFPA